MDDFMNKRSVKMTHQHIIYLCRDDVADGCEARQYFDEAEKYLMWH